MERLSNATNINRTDSNALILVGSFAPVHDGHLDNMRSAEKAAIARGYEISASVFTPNSDSYVLQKLNDKKGEWNFNRRISDFLFTESGTNCVSYVDDISGRHSPEKSISETAINNVSLALGIETCKLILVVGSDQVESMKPHVNRNKAICILRPGYEEHLKKCTDNLWFKDAVNSGRLILANRENIKEDISSTAIRRILELKGIGND